MLHLGADYWKPIQSGLDGLTDQKAVQNYTQITDPGRYWPSAYELNQPLSPHESAKRDGICIDMARFDDVAKNISSSPRPVIL